MTGGEVLLVLAAVTAGAFLKSITGMGLPIIAIPILSFAIGVDEAIAVLALPNLLVNASLAFQSRLSYPETRDLPAIAGFGVVGAVIGTIVLVSISEKPVVALLGIVVAAYAVLFFVRPEASIDAATSKRWAPPVGLISGFLQGSIGISGPVVGTWIHSYRLPRGAHILSVTTLFSITGFAQLVVLAVTGELGTVWAASLAACVPAIAMVPLGTRLRNRLSSLAFDRAIAATLVVSTTSLVIRTFG